MTLQVKQEDVDAVEAAIVKAEKQTCVEFFAVLADRSDDYQFVAGFFVAVWLFIAGLIFALFARLYWIDISALAMAGIELAAFLLVYSGVHTFPGLAIRLVPKWLRFKRAHANAAQQFLAHGISDTSDRNGVLIFVSLEEHYAEIMADSGVAGKTEQSFWDEAVAILIKHAKAGEVGTGYVVTIDLLGVQLAPIFPPGKKVEVGLDDKLVLLSSD